jgi:hypothetical protein
MSTPVFVWRDGIPPTYNMHGLCRYCSTKTVSSEINGRADEEMDSKLLDHWRASYEVPEDTDGYGWWACFRSTCPRCGWWINYAGYNTGAIRTLNAALQVFDINDEKIAIPEICSHLQNRFADVFSLAPRRFEEVIAQVYRELGGGSLLPFSLGMAVLTFIVSATALVKLVSSSVRDMRLIEM